MRTHTMAKMNRAKYTFLVAALAAVVLTSCLGKEEEVEYSDECYITAFSLSSIKQEHHIKGSEGQDSLYYTVFAGSSFPMTIDQRNNLIENREPLPYGAKVNRVLTNCTFQSVLLHRPKDIRDLTPADTAWVKYSNKDSIDFSAPREFLVIASDGKATRRYTVKVNVRSTDPQKTVWDSLGVTPAIGAGVCQERRMAVAGDKLVLLMQDASGNLTCATRPATTSGAWEVQSPSGADNAVATTLQENGGYLYMSTTDGMVLYSTDGKEWHTRMNGMPGLKLVGASNACLYAIQDGKLLATRLSSEDWQVQTLDDKAELLPDTDIAMVSMEQKNGNKRLLLTGKSADGKEARSWSKIWTDADGERAAAWAYHSPNAAISIPFPLLKQVNVLAYGGELLAFGGKPETGEGEAMAQLYSSKDFGVTWQRDYRLTLDERVTQTAADASLITATCQDGRFIWLLIDGSLWRFCLNAVAF